MFKKIIKTNLIPFLLVFILLINLFYVFSCSAGPKTEIFQQMAGAGSKAWGGQAPGPSGMTTIIQYIISAFLGLLGIIFLVLIIYAGYNWMTAGGDEEKVTKAKETLQRAVIGLIIITAAYSITYFVFSNLPDGGGTPAAPAGTNNSGL